MKLDLLSIQEYSRILQIMTENPTRTKNKFITPIIGCNLNNLIKFERITFLGLLSR